MNPTTRLVNDSTTRGKLYMAMELSQSKWHVAFGNGSKVVEKKLEAGDVLALMEAIKQAREKLKLSEEAPVWSCYEAGRDGFWIHRCLEQQGIKNEVIDSSSIVVDRKAKRRKTDRLDAQYLLRQLIWHVKGEVKLQTVHVPSEEAEDRRRLHRERERLKKERTSHTNRLKSLLTLYGIAYKKKGTRSWETYLTGLRDWKGEVLGVHQGEELAREVKRLQLVESQLKEIERQIEEQLRDIKAPTSLEPAKRLMALKGIGQVGAWILSHEWFAWREFKNRREVGAAAGLVGSPYQSGSSQREQGISKAGNKHIRALMIQLAWLWLKHQAQSKLSKWFIERFGQGERSRKLGIVALARRLLIALWRYIKWGELPEGAELKEAN